MDMRAGQVFAINGCHCRSSLLHDIRATIFALLAAIALPCQCETEERRLATVACL
jgi:hypothetical protein